MFLSTAHSVIFELLAFTIFFLNLNLRNCIILRRNTHHYSLYIVTITYLISFPIYVLTIY